MRKENKKTLLICAGLFLVMFGLSYAFVPIYNLICRVTGIDGTPRVATVKPHKIYDREIKVIFDATTDPGLPWRFKPKQKEMTVKVGEVLLAFYEAENLSSVPVTGRAVYNVQPDKMGYYFSKIECFCFTEQVLQPGQKIDMPMTFYVDPEIMDERTLDDVTEITLSYIFYPVNKD